LPAERILLQQADWIAANTAFEKQTLISLNVSPERISVIGVGVSPATQDATAGKVFRQRHSLPNAPIIAYLGRIAGSKGLDLLISAIAIARKTMPELHLVIAGARDSYNPLSHPQWGSAADSNDRSNHVLYDISEEDKDGLLNACTALVLPSHFESFGIVIAEAWLRHKPVIVSNCPALAEVVRDGVDGHVLNHNDPAELARAVTALVCDTELATTWGREGRMKVDRLYLWSNVGTRFVDGLLSRAFNVETDGPHEVRHNASRAACAARGAAELD
jgi:glycosyltransferase involved in cell wall biosynthesis